MGKAKLLGMKSTFVPNAKADMRFRKKLYQHNRKNYTSDSPPDLEAWGSG